MKKYRLTILDEYLNYSACGDNPFAGDVREEIGEFVIEYIETYGRSPSPSTIAENCISNDKLIELDYLKSTYIKMKNGEIDFDEYEKIVVDFINQ